MSATKLTQVQIAGRIAEIEAEPRVLIGSDGGTHGKPDHWQVYEEVASGDRYAVYSFAHSNGSRQDWRDAEKETPGRIRWFREQEARAKELRRELRALRGQLETAVAR